MENVQINALPVNTEKGRKKPKIAPSKIVIFCVLLLYTFLLFFPLYIVLVTSITSVKEITSTTSFIWIPKHPTMVAYGKIFTEDIKADRLGAPSLLIGFANTIWMSLLPLVVGLVVSGLSAFAFAKLDFPGRDRIFRIAFTVSLVPLGAFGIISYTFYSMLGWLSTPLPIIIPGMFGGMGTVFFLKMYYEGIPDSIIEASRIDGLHTIGIFFRMVFPLAIPAFVAQFIFGFVGRYNNYLSALLYLEGEDKLMTLQLVLAQIRGIFNGIGQESVHCAAAVLGMLPLIIIYCFSQKLFIEGVAVGSVKG